MDYLYYGEKERTLSEQEIMIWDKTWSNFPESFPMIQFK